MSTGNTLLGKVSLGSSILGILLPVCLAMVGLHFAKPGGRMGPSDQELAVLGLSVLLFLILELLALGCGIAARRTAWGVTGLLLAGIVFLSLPPLIAWLIASAKWSAAFILGIPLMIFLVWIAPRIRAVFQK